MFGQFFKEREVVVFDLDGTIINSDPLWNEAFKTVYENLGHSWRGKNFVSGGGIESVWEEYLDFEQVDPGVPISQLVTQTKSKFLELLKDSNLDVREGFWPFVGELKEERGYKLGLVTNTDKDVAQRVIDHLGISDIFEVKLFGDDVKHKKPHPEIYKRAIREFGLKAWKILVFEDSPTGAKAADKAGLETIVIWTPLESPSQAEYPRGILAFVPDFSAFPGNLDKTKREVYVELQERAQEQA